jgi:hypothetical protein
MEINMTKNTIDEMLCRFLCGKGQPLPDVSDHAIDLVRRSFVEACAATEPKHAGDIHEKLASVCP